MFKKIISISLCMILFLCMTIPTYATQEDPELSETKTIEDILNEYHERAFQQEISAETDTPSFYSRSSEYSNNTPEDETIQELTAAGYEAYNVTTENYDYLESALKTDFEELGLDYQSSYIVAISGSDNAGCNTIPISKGIDDPDYDYGDEGASSYFSYTYLGTTYQMRYLYVSASSNINYGKASSYNIINEEADQLEDRLNTKISVVADIIAPFPIGTVLSILGIDLIDIDTTRSMTMTYQAGTNWTRVFVQVYNASSDEWKVGSSVEYASMYSAITGIYYDRSINRYTPYISDETVNRIYTSHYNDYAWMKEKAAEAFMTNTRTCEYTGNLKYYYDETLLFTHTEYYGGP